MWDQCLPRCVSVCLPAPSQFLCLGFLFLSPPPSSSDGAKEAALIAKAAQSTDAEIVRNFSVEWRRNLTKLREGCFDERTGWGANHV